MPRFRSMFRYRGVEMRRIAAAILIFIILSASLPAIGFGYHVFEIRTELEFGYGVFPSSVMYQFNFPMPDFIPGTKTELAFRLDNGLVYRHLRQNPDDGSFLALDPPSYPTEYTVLFDEFNLFFGQGFVDTGFSDNDLITLFLSIDGRFENAYERLSWLSGPGEREGVFGYSDGSGWVDRFPGSSWIGAPELAGDRMMFQTSLTTGVVLDYMRDKVTRRDGVWFASYLRLAPDFMILNDGTGNFIASWNELKLSKTLFSVDNEKDYRDLSWVSIVLDNHTVYRYLFGDRVPQYILGGDIWGNSDVPAYDSVLTNRLSLTIYGPQINSRDTYPLIRIFWDFGVGFGHPLNSIHDDYGVETVGSYGVRAEFIIFDIAQLYYEIGCVYDPAFNEKVYVEQRFGFSVGI